MLVCLQGWLYQNSEKTELESEIAKSLERDSYFHVDYQGEIAILLELHPYRSYTRFVQPRDFGNHNSNTC